MANYGSKDFKIELDDSGGTLRDISAYVRTINGVEIEAILEDSHGFGKQWAESLWASFSRMAPVVIGGIYDDAALTPDALWSRGAERTLKITYGSTKTTTTEVKMQKYRRFPEMEKATKYEMTLVPTGTVTEA